MPLYTSIGGVRKEIASLYTGIDGVKKEIQSMYSGNGGVKETVFSGGKKLGAFDIGAEILLYENTNVLGGGTGYAPYIVIDHGTMQSGVTLLIRKYVPTTAFRWDKSAWLESPIYTNCIKYINGLTDLAQSYLVSVDWVASTTERITGTGSSTGTKTIVNSSAFILDSNQLGFSQVSTKGENLPYFSADLSSDELNERRKATTKAGSASTYALPEVVVDINKGSISVSTLRGINKDGSITPTNVRYLRVTMAFSSEAKVIDNTLGG